MASCNEVCGESWLSVDEETVIAAINAERFKVGNLAPLYYDDALIM
jgi:uncharacterized protein YkwD